MGYDKTRISTHSTRWLIATLLLGLTTGFVFLRWSVRQDSAIGCDTYGYFRSARVFRHAFEKKQWPDFALKHPQIDEMISVSKKLAADQIKRWDEIVAPHAHHYHARSDQVILQYPPTTGLLLSLFSEGKSAMRFSQLVAAIVLLLSVVLLFLNRRRPTIYSIPLFIAAIATLILCDTVANYSYSMQTTIVSLVLSFVFLESSQNSRSREAVLQAGLSGLFLAVATTARLPNLFLLPGWLYTARAKPKLALATVYFCVTGLILGVYHFQHTGHPLESTYSANLNTHLSLSHAVENLKFYLYRGGAQFNWAIVTLLLCAFFTYPLLPKSTALGSRRAAAGSALPIVYFLLYPIPISYYLFPALLSAMWLFAITLYGSEEAVVKNSSRRILIAQILGIVGLIGGSLFLTYSIIFNKIGSPSPVITQQPTTVDVAVLEDPNAFIFSDLYSGSIWHYFNRPAFKLNFTDATFRQQVLQELARRGKRLYWLDDGPDLKSFESELEPVHAEFQKTGMLLGRDLYEIRMPPSAQ